MKKSLVEVLMERNALETALVEAKATTDAANAAYQTAWLEGHTAKNKAAKANAAAQAEADISADLEAVNSAIAEMFGEMTQSAIDAELAEAEAEADFDAKVAAAKAEAKLNRKIRRTDAELRKESKELDPERYVEKIRKEADKAERKEAAAEAKANAKARAKAKAEGVLALRPSGIWARREMKSAKESAKWLRLLLDLEEAKIPPKGYMNLHPDKEADQAAVHAELEAWRKSLEYRDGFTAAEKAYEVFRRRLANAEASEFLDHPAKAAALSFSNEFLAACAMLGEDFDTLAEQGCKGLYDGMARWNKAIETVEENIHDIEIKMALAFKYGCDDEMTMQVIREKYRPQYRALRKELNELRAERKILAKAVKLAKKDASAAELALIESRGKVCAKQAHAPKAEEGRTYAPLAKPEMKGFKLMAFEAEYFISRCLKDQKKLLVKASIAYEQAKKDKKANLVSDDFVAKAKKDVRDAFRKLTEMGRKMLADGESFETDSTRCQINNGRQSQLWDVIEVPYGSETDMVVSIEHNMANFLPLVVKEALDDDETVAQRNIDGLETVLLNVLTMNGLTISFKAKDGSVRKNHYRFWNANNSALKVGKCYILSDDAYDKAKFAAQAGMTDEEFWKIPTNGSDMLKWWSYASTPGCPLMYNGEYITPDDVLLVDSIDTIREFENVLEFDANGKSVRHAKKGVERTAFDGALYALVPIPSQQIRGAMSFKGYLVNCAYDEETNMIDEIARREGLKIPEYIKDIDGKMRRWRDYKIIATKDAWKWASYGISYEEFCNRMRKMAETNPAINRLYTARIADATEESARHLTRQSTQQFMFATNSQIDELLTKSVNRVNRYRTHAGVIRNMAGLDKPEESRNAFEHLLEVAPEWLDADLMKRVVEDRFNRDVAEGAVRPLVDGIYPYITEDPVTFFKIVIFGMNPNQLGLGYLKPNQVNIPGAAEGKEMYLVRYPNNYLCGMIASNHNDDIYRCVGNTMVLSIDGYFLIRADGDVDGDEMCAIFNQVAIDMMKKTTLRLNPPLIVFPHQKLGKEILSTFEERAYALARAMVIANKFGPAVGQNSNLATKFMHKAAIARVKVGNAMTQRDRKAEINARAEMNHALNDAIVAHIAAIIAIDLAKTGEMPAWLEALLKPINKAADKYMKKMPWNQRFCRDSKAEPWFSETWYTTAETDGVVDRIASRFIELTDARNYEAPTGSGFNVLSVLGDSTGLYIQGSDGKLENAYMRMLDSRNFTKTNTEGDDEIKMLQRLHSDDPEEIVGSAELWRFFWRNQAALVYKFQKGGDDRVQNAAANEQYLEVVHDIMVNFGSYCGNKTFAKLSVDKQQKSNVWKALKYAFGKNVVGKQYTDKAKQLLSEYEKLAALDDELALAEASKIYAQYELEMEKAMSAKSSFAYFVTKVLAYDIYKMACEAKDVAHPWVRPEAEPEDGTLCFSSSETRNMYDDDMRDWTAGCVAC